MDKYLNFDNSSDDEAPWCNQEENVKCKCIICPPIVAPVIPTIPYVHAAGTFDVLPDVYVRDVAMNNGPITGSLASNLNLATGAFTVPTTGMWKLFVTATFQPPANLEQDGERYIRIVRNFVNGQAEPAFLAQYWNNAPAAQFFATQRDINTTGVVSTVTDLQVGDTLSLLIFTSSRATVFPITVFVELTYSLSPGKLLTTVIPGGPIVSPTPSP